MNSATRRGCVSATSNLAGTGSGDHRFRSRPPRVCRRSVESWTTAADVFRAGEGCVAISLTSHHLCRARTSGPLRLRLHPRIDAPPTDRRWTSPLVRGLLDGQWHTFDARNNTPRIGRVVVVAARRDRRRPDHLFGFVSLNGFEVRADPAPERAAQPVERLHAGGGDAPLYNSGVPTSLRRPTTPLPGDLPGPRVVGGDGAHRRFEERAGRCTRRRRSAVSCTGNRREATMSRRASTARARLPDLEYRSHGHASRADKPRCGDGRALRSRRRLLPGAVARCTCSTLAALHGGYGIVGGNLRSRQASGSPPTTSTRRGDLCTFGDGASNQAPLARR